MEITQKKIKNNIKEQMSIKNMNVKILAKKAEINVIVLIFLLYCSFSKLKLSSFNKICKAMKINMSEVF